MNLVCPAITLPPVHAGKEGRERAEGRRGVGEEGEEGDSP